MSVPYKPAGRSAVSPYLLVNSVGNELKFVQTVFDCEVMEGLKTEEGEINHAEVTIDGSTVMMGQAQKDYPPTPSMVHVYVPNCDETYKKALNAGGRSIMEPTQQFYGDRSAGVVSPEGIQWWLATHVEELSEDEMQKRHAEEMKNR